MIRPFESADGLATIGAGLVAVRALLEARFVQWAEASGAESMLFPALVPVADLEALDYFRSFPHLAFLAGRIDDDQLGRVARGVPVGDLERGDVVPTGYALPSAACYGVYLHRRQTQLSGPVRVTTVATCFRNESVYEGLQRLRAFSMREVVCLGSADVVREHLRSFKTLTEDFCVRLTLPIAIQAATDPFFETSGSRAAMQQLFPVKEEVVYGGTTAIASFNFHRNFFGERCGILDPQGTPVCSGCAAFGIERWMHALLDRFGDAGAAASALARA